jgi:hypothetical protein
VRASHSLTVTLRKEGQVELSGGGRLNNLARRDSRAPADRVNPNLLWVERFTEPSVRHSESMAET